MKVVTIVSEIRVLGSLWIGGIAATNYRLTSFQLEDILDYCDGKYNRNGVEQWLLGNSGDFQDVIDFAITIGDNEFDSDWEKNDSEDKYIDCMFPDSELNNFWEDYELQSQ